jgi:beta-propeller repeat-containing protein
MRSSAINLLPLLLILGAVRSAPAQEFSYGDLPLYFLANQGQISESQVEYYLTGSQQTVYFTAHGLTLAQRSGLAQNPSRSVVKLDFVDPNPEVQILPQLPQSTIFNYFLGPQQDWHTEVPSFRQLLYAQLWPGIDLLYTGEVGRLKYRFLVHPGADPGQIGLRYRGITGLTIQQNGDLQISLPGSNFSDLAPSAYQSIGSAQQSVAVQYELGNGAAEYGFSLGEYDPTEPLIIDPALLIYCGYLGGSGVDTALGVAVDGQNRAYLTGTTWSDELSFPVITGPDLAFNSANGTADVFVARLNPAGTALEYCGYLGGLKDDWGRAIAVDAAGAAYLAGDTQSDQASFPVLLGPDLSFNSANLETDGFVAKINPQGTSLEYCGYLGGENEDSATGIAVDAVGQAYLTGFSKSDEHTFPVKVGPDLSYNISTDAFVARVNVQGTKLDYCGYIGGMRFDLGQAIAVDASGRAYVTGNTFSNEGTFPVMFGPDLTYNAGWDAFVARVNPAGTELEYCGYLGGERFDSGRGIAVDDMGHAFVTGFTYSEASTFPVLVGPDLSFNGYGDAFIARVSDDGGNLEYCGYLGGVAFDYGNAIALDSFGNAYIGGHTNSNEVTFPVLSGPGLISGGLEDAFLARINSVGTRLDYCGYVGGEGNDRGFGIAVDSLGDAYLVGDVASDQSTFPVQLGPDLLHNGQRDAFVAKVEARFLELRVDPLPLQSGQSVHAALSKGAAQSDSYLVYSLIGPGQTPIFALGVISDLLAPVQIGGKKISDGLGATSWNLTVPTTAIGLQVWVQALQFGKASNVVITAVQ